jgi:uncharacterized membrane protein
MLNDGQREAPAGERDPIEIIVRQVPKHIWVCLGAVAVMLFLGVAFTKGVPSRADTGGAAGVTNETLQGRVAAIQPPAMPVSSTDPGTARVLVDITSGSQQGRRVQIHPTGGTTGLVGDTPVQVGDKVLVEYSTGGPQGDQYAISDFVRLPQLLIIALIFAAATIAVGRWVGLRALISVGISILAIFGCILPGISAGRDPLMVCLAGSLLLMIASLYLIYQWQWKTHAAAFSIGITLIVSALLSFAFANMSHLTGFSSDETAMVSQMARVHINMPGLLMGGVLVGAAGVLGDVAVTQTSAVFELKQANAGLNWRELFRHAMAIGRDHISSMINTLLLAYASASLPLILLLAMQNPSFTETLNREFIAEEVVRTLVGSLGLIVAVPLASLIASLIAARHGRVGQILPAPARE